MNAYTGQVSLYQWGGNDPVLDDWMRAFPGVVKPRSAIPGYLVPHLRYPPDEFEVQRQILAQYHVAQAPEFYGGQNFWSVPTDPSGTNPNAATQPPYYLTMTMPGQTQPEFSLTTTFTPRGRANMAAFMAVDSNPQSRGLRPDPDPGAAAGHHDPRAAAGPGGLRVQPHRRLRADPAAPGRLQRHPGQPGHDPGRRRPALLRAGVRGPERQGQLRAPTRPCRRCWSTTTARSASRRPCTGALAQVFSLSPGQVNGGGPPPSGSPPPPSGQQRQGQRRRAALSPAGRDPLRQGSGRAEERELRRLRPGPGADEVRAGQRPAGGPRLGPGQPASGRVAAPEPARARPASHRPGPRGADAGTATIPEGVRSVLREIDSLAAGVPARPGSVDRDAIGMQGRSDADRRKGA